MKAIMRITCDNTKIWYKKNNPLYFHRQNGPASEYADGSKCWYLNDIYYSNPNYMPLNLFLVYIKWELKKHEQHM